MRREMLRGVTSLTLASMLLAACGVAVGPAPLPEVTQTSTSAPAMPLDNTEWVLASLRGQPLLPGTHVSLEFKGQSFGGFTGCNYYGGGPANGPYRVTVDGTLTFRSFEVTAMGCRAGIMVQEKAYIEALTSVVSYRLLEDRLELQDAAGATILVYARLAGCAEEPVNLVGTAWQLVSVDGREPAGGPATTLAFLDGRWFVEHSRCAGYVSSYQITGHDLQSGFSTWLGQVCQDEEGHGVTMLEMPADYCLAQGRLQIRTVPGPVFIYEGLPEAARPALEGPTWSLLSIVGQRLIEGEAVAWPDPYTLREGTEITLAFDDGAASGSAGCNSYGAAYTLDEVSLAFGDVAATERGCLTPEGVMEQEQRYLRALREVTDYRMVGSQLWLRTDGQQALVYAAKIAAPKPGSTP